MLLGLVLKVIEHHPIPSLELQTMLRTLSILLILGMVWGAVNACDMSSGGVPLENVPLIRVPLDQISSMTFYRDGMTIGRRLAPTPQLKCNGGSAEGLAGGF